MKRENVQKAGSYDYLTGLPRLTYFFELLEAREDMDRKDGTQTVFLFVDLCGMKFYNSRFGFKEGDQLLKAFAELLGRLFDPENCCHIGEDHFAVYTEEENLESVLEKMFQESGKLNEGKSLPVHVGVYSSRMEEVPAGTALERAKVACDAIRKKYGSDFRYYEMTLREDLLQRQYVLSNFDRALDEKWIQVYYQPIMRAVTGLVCDEEALARWFDPDAGFLSPAGFIPHLEDAGQIYRLDLYVLERILEKIKTQEEAGLYAVPQSLNLSRSDFDSCDIVEEVRRRVDESGISRNKITIEITESTVGSDFDFMKEQVQRFQELGFSVWMDDFGSGYSSMEVLQGIHFDLIKFDMSFMRRFDEGDSAKIVLTELMRMATALGVDTVCEGVETKEQVQFLKEIGCSKLQGFFFQKPIPLEEILAKLENKTLIQFENPEEASYYETIGRVNLYDLAVIAGGNETDFLNLFNTIPLCIMEIHEGMVRFIRSNQSYRDYMMRFFGFSLSEEESVFTETPFLPDSTFTKMIRDCCTTGNRAFFDEQLPDGSVAHLFARRIGSNPVTGTVAATIAVLSVTESDAAAIYVRIARALAGEYQHLFYVDLETEHFMEFGQSGETDEIAIEQHGEGFFKNVRENAGAMVYPDDRDMLFSHMAKENILRDIEEKGSFSIVYRILVNDTPVYVELKAIRNRSDWNHLIVVVSVLDSRLKMNEKGKTDSANQDMYAWILALAGDYLSLYWIDPDTDHYREYGSTSVYETLGFEKEGDDFFRRGAEDGKTVVCEEDLPKYLEEFQKENILREIREKGIFQMHYHLMINGKPRPVSLRITKIRDRDGEKLIAGVRAWRERK